MRLNYETTISHRGLGKERTIKGTDRRIVEQRAREQLATWDRQWEKEQEREQIKIERERNRNIKIQQSNDKKRRIEEEAERKKRIAEEERQYKEDRISEAEELTTEAQEALSRINNTLRHTLSIDDTIQWDSLKDLSYFETEKPKKPVELKLDKEPMKDDPKYQYHTPNLLVKKIPNEPSKDDNKYIPKINFIDNLFHFLKAKKNQIKMIEFASDHLKWEEEKRIIDKFNIEEQIKYESILIELSTTYTNMYNSDHSEWRKKSEEINGKNIWNLSRYNDALSKWETQKQSFYDKQRENNAHIDDRKKEYLERSGGAVIDYCDMVLSNSEYPDNFPQDYEIDYNENSKILIVDYMLPAKDLMPTVKEVKYVPSKDEMKYSYLSEKDIASMYDSLIYQIAIRTLHELFEADAADALESIVLNGWVEAIDKSTGLSIKPCILSIHTKKEEFLKINLYNIDPKACFKSLKGISGAKLSELPAIVPLIKMDRTDTRFVDGYNVTDSIDHTVNLASMDWEDFEHLVREIFEKEFSHNGGEVKVTRASRDGGVDAIAFDPDPIRGGKIVIQAKRYTNVVGVSAVRDLYGTVLNEGATKGILVTTADFGTDSYDFSKDKPLTLINGSNLLYLLEKHGHTAKIDLKEAKLQNKF